MALCWFAAGFKMRAPGARQPEDTGWLRAPRGKLQYGVRKRLDISFTMTGVLYTYKKTLPEHEAEPLPTSLDNKPQVAREYDHRRNLTWSEIVVPVELDSSFIADISSLKEDEARRLIDIAVAALLKAHPGTRIWNPPS